MKLIISTMIVSIFMISTQAMACSCGEWGSAKEMLRDSDTVMLVVPLENSQFYRNGEYGQEVKTYMRVVKKYKGKFKNSSLAIYAKI